MFEIGFPELVLIAIVGLLVIGPERLPEALRTLGLWLGRMRRSFTAVKAEIEKEIGMDEVKRQLHNEAIMEEMKRIEAEVKNTADSARSSINEGVKAAEMPKIDPGSLAAMDAAIAAQDDPAATANPQPDTGGESTVTTPAPEAESGEAAKTAARTGDEQTHPQPTRAGDPPASADPAPTAGTDREQTSRG